MPQPVSPSVSGGDMASTPSTRPPRRPATAGQRAEAAEGGRPARDRPLVGRERVDAGDRAPRRGSSRTDRPAPPLRLDAVVRVPRQGGDDVELVAAVGQLEDDPGDDLAGGREVGREVGQRTASFMRAGPCDSGAGGSGRDGRRRPGRRPPAATRARPCPAGGDQPVALGGVGEHRVEGRRPGRRGRRVDAGGRRRRPPRAARSRRRRSPAVPTAIASSTGAPKPSYRLGKTRAAARRRRPSRSASGTRPGRTTRPRRPSEPIDRLQRRLGRARRRRAARGAGRDRRSSRRRASSSTRWFLCG